MCIRDRKGDDGISPHIGNNGNWWIGTTDTGIKAQGEKGVNGASAYELWVNDVIISFLSLSFYFCIGSKMCIRDSVYCCRQYNSNS